jgi:predicted transcriptional regulator of viral defense system
MASVIFDAVVYYQDHLFGQMLQDSWDSAKREFQPRKRNSRYAQAYEQLPSPFSVSDVERVLGVTNNAAAQHCKRWLQSGYIDRQKQGTYVKLITSIQL